MPSTFREAFDLGETLTRGYEALKAAPWPILLGAVLMQCTEVGGGGGGGGSPGSGGYGGDGGGGGGGGDWQSPGSWIGDLQPPALDQLTGSIGGVEIAILTIILVAVVGFVLACSLALFALRTWVVVGYLRVQREALDAGTGRFEILFGGADKFWSMAGFSLLRWIIVLGTLLLAAIPGGLVVAAGLLLDLNLLAGAGALLLILVCVGVSIYVSLGLALGGHAVALEGLCTLEAIERSWELVRGHRLWLAVYLVVLGILHLAGFCVCCFGVFLTRALTDTALTAAYLQLTRGPLPAGEALAAKP